VACIGVATKVSDGYSNPMRLLGLDEAGRGSVLGPLVVGGFCWEGAEQAPLRDAGADDSKRLSARKRVAIRERLVHLGEGQTVSITPAEIDRENINDLELAAFALLIGRLRPELCFIDAPTHPRAISGFMAKLRDRLRRADVPVPELIVEPKADATYPVVGAASIFAKVERDAAMEALKSEGKVGSGYPSDPVTRQWLTEALRTNAPLPDCVRTRWGTIDQLRQQVLFAGPTR